MRKHQTAALMARALECGLLDGMPHFSCTHYPELSPEGYGQSAFEFADFGPQHTTLRFIFRGDGTVLFSGCPNQWSAYQNSDIFRGHSDAATVDLSAFTLDSIPTIKQTLDLYFETIPHKDYSGLLQLWSHVHPALLDTPRDAHMSHPWWRFWRA
jgi:hypothetical protein